MIEKLEKEINDLNSTLGSLKQAQTSMVDEHFNVYDTSVEKVEKVKRVTCPALKSKIKNVKGQLTHVISLYTTSSTSSSSRGILFKKNPHVTRKI